MLHTQLCLCMFPCGFSRSSKESSMISKVVYCKQKLNQQHSKSNIFLVIMFDSFWLCSLCRCLLELWLSRPELCQQAQSWEARTLPVPPVWQEIRESKEFIQPPGSARRQNDLSDLRQGRVDQEQSEQTHEDDSSGNLCGFAGGCCCCELYHLIAGNERSRK